MKKQLIPHFSFLIPHFSFLIPLLLTACGSKTASTGWAVADSTQTATAGGKHSAEYIIQRLDSIYLLRVDSLCCSQRYLDIYAQAQQISQSEGTVFLDSDHWTQGQDIPEDWSYSVESVSHITDSTAQACVIIHSFDEQRVTLDLVFERDNWYVDNFRSLYEGADYDSGGNKIPDSEGIKEYNELKSLQEYISQEHAEPTPDVTDEELQAVPRRNTLKEAEAMTEAAKKRLEEFDE